MLPNNSWTMPDMPRLTQKCLFKMHQELLKINWLMLLMLTAKDNMSLNKTSWIPWEIAQSALVATQHAMMSAQDMSGQTTSQIALAHHIAIHA